MAKTHAAAARRAVNSQQQADGSRDGGSRSMRPWPTLPSPFGGEGEGRKGRKGPKVEGRLPCPCVLPPNLLPLPAPYNLIMNPAILCQDLRKRYPARPVPVDAVNGLDLEVRVNECF